MASPITAADPRAALALGRLLLKTDRKAEGIEALERALTITHREASEHFQAAARWRAESVGSWNAGMGEEYDPRVLDTAGLGSLGSHSANGETGRTEKDSLMAKPAVPNGGAAAAASAGRVATDRESVVTHLRILADHIGARPAGSEDVARARRYVIQAIRDRGFSPDIQPFFIATSRYERCELAVEGGRAIPCLPAMGSAPTRGTISGVLRPFPPGGWVRSGVECDDEAAFLLCPLRPGAEHEHIRVAFEQRAAAVLVYHDGVPDLYSEVLPPGLDGAVPCVTIRRTDAQWLEVARPQGWLTVTRTPVKISCSNIIVEAGQGGRPLLFLAHYDTRPGTPGALRNASGVATLLELLTRLRGWTGQRILVGFLDAEECGGAGSRQCRDVFQALGLRNFRGVVYVSGVGLRGVAVLSVPDHSASHLANVARRCAAKEGMLLADELVASGQLPIPPGVWPYRTIALSGPPAVIQHTSADRPELLHPGFLLRSVSVLDRLARAL